MHKNPMNARTAGHGSVMSTINVYTDARTMTIPAGKTNFVDTSVIRFSRVLENRGVGLHIG